MRDVSRHRFENLKPLPAPLAPVATAVIIGILIARRQFVPTVVWAIVLAGLIIAWEPLIYLCRTKFRGGGVKQLIKLILLGGFLCAAALRYQLIYYHYGDEHIIRYCQSQPRLATLRGTIVTEPYLVKGKGAFAAYHPANQAKTIFALSCEKVKGWNGWLKAEGLVQVVVSGAHLSLGAGQEVEIDGWIALRKGSDNPGQKNRYDYYHAARNLVACYADLPEGVTILTYPSLKSGWFYRLRQKIQSLAYSSLFDDLEESSSREDITQPYRSREKLTQQRETNGFLAALLLGQRYQLTGRLNETFMRTGTMHFLSVSGLHVGLLAGFVWGLVRLIGLERRGQGLITLTTIVLFMLMIPTRAPIIRAGVGCCIFCLAYMGRRQVNSINLLALAAMILLLWRPLELFQAGFQLSFVVVLGLLLFAGPILKGQWRTGTNDSLLRDINLSQTNGLAQAPPWWRYILYLAGRWLINLVVVAIVAWVVALPLIAYHFNRIAPWGILGSIVMFPLIGLTMLIGFTKLLLAAIAPILAYPLGVPLELAARTTIYAGKLLAALPFSNINTAAPPVWLILIFYALLSWAATNIRRGAGMTRPIWAGLLIWLVVFFWLAPFTKPLATGQTTRMDVLSVGQGAAVVLQLPDDKVIAYDCGSMAAFDVAGYTVGPFLRSQGIRHLDALFISHPNLDHYSGVLDLADQFEIKTVYINEYYEETGGALSKMLLEKLTEQKIPIRHISSGFCLECSSSDQEYRLEALWPPEFDPNRTLTSNDSSLVLRLSDENGSILLTGDISNDAQQALLQKPLNGNLAANVLLLPHHGAITETLPDFVNKVNPQVCVNSCGKSRENNFEKMDQLLTGRDILHTYEYGAVSIALTPDGPVVKTFHESKIVDE